VVVRCSHVVDLQTVGQLRGAPVPYLPCGDSMGPKAMGAAWLIINSLIIIIIITLYIILYHMSITGIMAVQGESQAVHI
jgi:hypothetical protein